ncbi:hypothetical protein [Brevibacillus choshinensis]|uniref:hypothetical protein n=1 Tax=Brevibacillus choshinensis TaxID=54911 RepID=UPI001EED3F57|nr:hypothetical protein [Brevibacillus choshinensis]
MKKDELKSCEIGPVNAKSRRKQAASIREDAAEFQEDRPLPPHPCNGDEEKYANKIGSYSKGLPHHSLGEVDRTAYKSLIKALESGDPVDFESIALGGAAKLTNPQGAYAFDLAGPDSHHLGMIAPPAFSSAWQASEMAELYWQALTRDVPFAEFSTNPLTMAAASDLTSFTDFRGPKDSGKVTTSTLFRGSTPGDLVGPYISQFLWKDIPYGGTAIVQKYRTTVAGDDHMTTYQDWLDIQNGGAPASQNEYDPTPRYIRNGRDLSEWVHRDFTFQSFLAGCLILLGFGQGALDAANPYLHSATQVGYVWRTASFGLCGTVGTVRPRGLLVPEMADPSPGQAGRVRGARPQPVDGSCPLPDPFGAASVASSFRGLQQVWKLPSPHGLSRRLSYSSFLSSWPRLHCRGWHHDAEGV